MGQHVDWGVFAVFGQRGFHEDKDGVVGTDFDVAELTPRNPVDVHAEAVVRVVAERHGGDVQNLVMTVIDNKTAGRRRAERQQ